MKERSFRHTLQIRILWTVLDKLLLCSFQRLSFFVVMVMNGSIPYFSRFQGPWAWGLLYKLWNCWGSCEVKTGSITSLVKMREYYTHVHVKPFLFLILSCLSLLFILSPSLPTFHFVETSSMFDSSPITPFYLYTPLSLSLFLNVI